VGGGIGEGAAAMAGSPLQVAVIGTGYVGLVSGACLADKGHQVTCVDLDAAKVAKINRAEPPIHEDGLGDLLQRNVPHRLRATTDLRRAVLDADLSIIAVGTPYDGAQIDLSFIRQAAAEIGAALREKTDYHVVIVKSTVVPGTTDGIVREALEQSSGKQAGRDFGIGMSPEFLREGSAVADFLNPDRIVIGGRDERTMDRMAELFAPFGDIDLVRTSNKTAEMIKYASNSLLATLISFSNEIGNLCAAVGELDAAEVMRGVHLDRRFSPLLADGTRVVPGFNSYVEAGCGFGGSCFPKDVRSLIAHGVEAGVPMQILHAVVAVNERQPQQILRLLEKHFPDLGGRRIAVLGLAFKPGTADMRESPAIPVITALRSGGATVLGYDPVAQQEAASILGTDHIVYCQSLEDAVQTADAIIVITAWEEFRQLPALIAGRDPQPLVVDGRRMLDKRQFARYEGIGLGETSALSPSLVPQRSS
jgi:UDPglucose 6-dehydrogenase